MELSQKRRRLGVLLLLLTTIGRCEEDCKGLEGEALKKVATITETSLQPKIAERYLNLMNEPCSTLNKGLILMSFQLKNTASGLATLMTEVLNALDPPSVAAMLRIVPNDARVWMLKAFVHALPCTQKDGVCEEEETKKLLKKFEAARDAYAMNGLVRLGLNQCRNF